MITIFMFLAFVCALSVASIFVMAAIKVYKLLFKKR